MKKRYMAYANPTKGNIIRQCERKTQQHKEI